jgi:PBP1b-binding outer membrane lipoprotein LpoB
MKTIVHLSLIALLPAILAGCATSGPVVVEGPKKVATMEVDTQDFAAKAEEMINSLVESTVLDKSAKKPAILAVGKIVRDVGYQIDTELLTKKIRTALNKSGKAMTDLTGGALNDPDFTISGRISDTKARVGNIRQRCYTFQLSLSNSQGLAVWEEEREICKQSKKSDVVF